MVIVVLGVGHGRSLVFSSCLSFPLSQKA
jgi:hypothetical protein